MRKNIFDIISENNILSYEVDRLIKLTEEEYCMQNYTLFDFVDLYCFKKWEYRGHAVDIEDYLDVLNYDLIKSDAKDNIESLFLMIELIYNFWNLAYKKVVEIDIKVYDEFNHLKNIMDDLLSQYNHTAYENIETNQILVIEDKPEITAVVEIVESTLTLDIIRYNHRSLKGEIEAKKAILRSLGAELEPKRKDLESLNKRLSDDIFFMLNNINIRHNNCNKEDKSKYKDYVANMTEDELEEWYDETYQMILLAFLLLDNIDRSLKVKNLKVNVAGQQ